MSFLTDTDILQLLDSNEIASNKNKLHIFPFDRDNCLKPGGYDVRIGSEWCSGKQAIRSTLHEGQSIIVEPGDVVLIKTLESIDMPADKSLSGLITSRVSLVSKGLSHISTNIDPDWKGNLLIALHNPSNVGIELHYGERLCTINFIKNMSPATRSCNYPPGRIDVEFEQFVKWTEQAKSKKAKRELGARLARFIVSVVSIGLPTSVGLIWYANKTEVVALVALGVALEASIRNFFYGDIEKT